MEVLQKETRFYVVSLLISKIKGVAFFLTIALLAFSFALSAQSSWYVSFTPGIDYVPPMRLVVNQQNYDKLSFRAEYETAPLKSPLYYSFRIGQKGEEKGWEAEINHLKIYLKNNPPEIQQFSISHGYNQFFINWVNYKKYFGTKVGAGVVFAHVENTVRNLKLDQKQGIMGWGYYLAGPAIQYGIFKEICITPRFNILVESKFSLAYANVPVVNGRAHVPVFALHFQLGPGFYFIKKGRLF